MLKTIGKLEVDKNKGWKGNLNEAIEKAGFKLIFDFETITSTNYIIAEEEEDWHDTDNRKRIEG